MKIQIEKKAHLKNNKEKNSFQKRQLIIDSQTLNLLLLQLTKLLNVLRIMHDDKKSAIGCIKGKENNKFAWRMKNQKIKIKLQSRKGRNCFVKNE